MEEETEEEGHTTTKLDICCFLSPPFLVQNDFRSRPLGSTGARGVIHLANKIQLSQNRIHLCYRLLRCAKADTNGSRRCLCRWRLVWWSWFLVNQSDGHHQFVWCQFALACFSHMRCPYISARSRGVAPLALRAWDHCTWAGSDTAAGGGTVLIVKCQQVHVSKMFDDVWSFDAGDGEGSWRS